MSRRSVLARLPLALLISGCAGVSGANLTHGAFPTTHKGRLNEIVYVNPLPGDPEWDLIGTCMARAGRASGITVRDQGPPGGDVDVQSMENLVSQAVADHAPAIVTWSLGAGAAFDPLFARERQQGGAVATLLSPDATHNQDFDVGVPWSTVAREQIDYVAAQPGQHRIGVIWQQPDGPGYSGYAPALRDEVSKHTNVTLEALTYDHGDFSQDETIAGAMLADHPEINGLIEYSGFPGTMNAVIERDLIGKVAVYAGWDYPEQTKEFIDRGVLQGVAIDDPCGIGKRVVAQLQQVWAGHAVAPESSDGARVVSGQEFKALAAEGAL